VESDVTMEGLGAASQYFVDIFCSYNRAKLKKKFKKREKTRTCRNSSAQFIPNLM